MQISKVSLFFISLIVLCSILWISSCQHSSDLSSDLPEICFEREVLPIILNNCSITGCHDGTGESDLTLNSYLDISHAVEPGNPSQSDIYQAITTRSGENRMPPDMPLSLENRTVIRVWIEQGALLTVCPDDNPPAGQHPDYINPRACFSRDILRLIACHHPTKTR